MNNINCLREIFFCLRFVVFIFFVALRLIFAFNVTYTREKILLRVLFNAFNKFYVTFSLFFFGDSFRLLLPQHLVSKFTQDTKNDEMERRRRKTKRRMDSRGTLGDFYSGSSFRRVIFHRVENLPLGELNKHFGRLCVEGRRGRPPQHHLHSGLLQQGWLNELLSFFALHNDLINMCSYGIAKSKHAWKMFNWNEISSGRAISMIWFTNTYRGRCRSVGVGSSFFARHGLSIFLRNHHSQSTPLLCGLMLKKYKKRSEKSVFAFK